VLVATTIYFNTPISGQSIFGCSVAIGGVLLYVASERHERKTARFASTQNIVIANSLQYQQVLARWREREEEGQGSQEGAVVREGN